jgi:hypothetical protein
MGARRSASSERGARLSGNLIEKKTDEKMKAPSSRDGSGKGAAERVGKQAAKIHTKVFAEFTASE